MISKRFAVSCSLLLFGSQIAAKQFDVSCNSNYVSYYGQNSARNQQSLGTYCKDATEDVIVLAFMNGFPNVLLNFANACETTFDGSTLLHCPTMAADIQYCQSQGKAVLLSMGGASGAYGFSSDSDGTQFADTVWNMFFKGSAARRPFDDAVLDGIDLDIEGGSSTGYAAFINQMRSHYASDPSKQYYIASAPQCPYPDAYLGSTLNSAWFDMVFVQFYNNYCGLNAYPTWFNYADWDTWAKTSAINKNVKIFIGAPGSASAASSGYVDGSTLTTIYNAVRSSYSSLGGIMTWDVSQARTSGLASSIRSMLNSGGTCGSNPPSTSSSSSTTIPTTSSSTASSSTTSFSSSSTNSTLLSTSDLSSSPTAESASKEGSHSANTGLITTTVTLTTTVTSVSTFVSTILSTVTIMQTDASSNTGINTSVPVSTLSFSSSSLSDISAPTLATNTTTSKCPIEGVSCVEGSQGCNKSGYALCVNGKWTIYNCYAGTTCYMLGNTAACDWEGSQPKDVCTAHATYVWSVNAAATKMLQSSNSDARPMSVYTTRGVRSRIEIIPLSASKGHFVALVKIQTLLSPISKRWVLQMQLPQGQSIDYTSNGHIVTHGSMVTINSNNPNDLSPKMALSMEIRGRYTGSYRLPNLSAAMVNNH